VGDIMSTTFFLYAVRDTETGELVNDITGIKRRFWESEGTCRNAIKRYHEKIDDSCKKHKSLELVKLICLERKDKR